MTPRRRAAAGMALLLGLLSSIAAAAPGASAENWRRAEALAAAQSVDTAAAAEDIFRDTLPGNGAAVLQKLAALESRSDWPVPAREAALYRYTRQLAQLPRADVAAAVLKHLRSYQARTLVPHEDYAGASVPLYNISAAAAGVENTWLRREAADEAAELLQNDPAAMVDRYLSSNATAQRSGYLEALGQADPAVLDAVRQTAQKRLANAPELTPLLGATLAIDADGEALRQLLIDGRGAGLAKALRRAANGLPVEELTSLLRLAIEQAPSGNAALAIAAWWPALRHETAAQRLLLDHLADPVLGEAAALALAQAPDAATIRALQNLAAGESAAAVRARLALDVNRNTIATETPR